MSRNPFDIGSECRSWAKADIVVGDYIYLAYLILSRWVFVKEMSSESPSFIE